METLNTLLEALAWPEFPVQPWPQAAFVSTLFCLLVGLLFLIIPGRAGGVLGLVGRDTRPAGIGELRAAGGFMAGLSLAALLFFDQPVMVTVLGVALILSTFARLISLMSDTSASLLNILLLIIQAGLSAATLIYFFEVVTPDFTFGVPTEFAPQLAFFAFAGMAVVGGFIMFAPRLAMMAAGLWVAEDRPGGIASVRSAGGFLAGAGLFGMALAGVWESAMVVLLMASFGYAAALAVSIIGRLLAFAINRGNLVYNLVALAVQVVALGLIATYISSAL